MEYNTTMLIKLLNQIIRIKTRNYEDIVSLTTAVAESAPASFVESLTTMGSDTFGQVMDECLDNIEDGDFVFLGTLVEILSQKIRLAPEELTNYDSFIKAVLLEATTETLALVNKMTEAERMSLFEQVVQDEKAGKFRKLRDLTETQFF